MSHCNWRSALKCAMILDMFFLQSENLFSQGSAFSFLKLIFKENSSHRDFEWITKGNVRIAF